MYDCGRIDENDIEDLNDLMVEITDAYAKGKITEEHYSFLNGKISDCNNKQQKR